MDRQSLLVDNSKDYCCNFLAIDDESISVLQALAADLVCLIDDFAGRIIPVIGGSILPWRLHCTSHRRPQSRFSGVSGEEVLAFRDLSEERQQAPCSSSG